MKKIKVKINKPIYLGISILDISKTLTYDFWYDYIKPKYQDNAKLCYMDTDFYDDIADDAEKWFDTSNYDDDHDDRPLQKGMNKIVTGLMKDELGGKIITEFVALGPKTYSYLTDDDKNVKKLKEQKNV